jgi:hypothetical protein
MIFILIECHKQPIKRDLMEIQKLRNKNIVYVSCDLLNAGVSLDAASNVASLKEEYLSTSTVFFTSHIHFNELKNEYILEEFSNSNISTLLIEEDMFNNEKVWIKEGDYANYVLEKLNNNEILNGKIKETLIKDSIQKLFEKENISSLIIEKLKQSLDNESFTKIIPEKIKKEFLSIAEKMPIKVLYSSSKEVEISFSKDDLIKIKDTCYKSVLSSIDTKNLLSQKESSLNNKESKPSNKIIKKIKPL